jgi:AcrR family transcriptional regulator
VDRFESLVEAATQVFLEQGYRRTQIADVAARMGLSKGSIYTYVESKEALFDCVVRYADHSERIELPEALPVPTPRPAETLARVRKRLADESALPILEAALARTRVGDVRAEARAVLGELYDTLARHRIGITLLDRCAADYPELAKLWFRGSREGVLLLLARYVDDRVGRGRFRRLGESAITARSVLEGIAFWAVHRHQDPSPQAVDDGSARDTALAFLTAALVKESQ